jgi:phosphatidylglycerophosphatase A
VPSICSAASGNTAWHLAFGMGFRHHVAMFWTRFFATGFWVGRIPFAPGTWGTLVGVPFVLLFRQFGPVGYLIAAVALVVAAIWIANLYERLGGEHDSSEVVVDEIAGFVISMAWLPVHTWQSWVAAFLLFRVLDITKPLAIGRIDRDVKGGPGVVLDDVLSGVVCNVVLQMIYQRTNWLGEQWTILPPP